MEQYREKRPTREDDLSIARVSTIAPVGPSLVLPSARLTKGPLSEFMRLRKHGSNPIYRSDALSLGLPVIIDRRVEGF